GRDLSQRLIVAHDVQIVIGPDVEERQNLVEHLPVLRRDADDAGEMIRMTLELFEDRGHFDGFRSSAEDREDFHRGEAELFVKFWYCSTTLCASPMARSRP